MELEQWSLYLRLGAPVPGLDKAGHGHEEPHDRHVDTAWPDSLQVTNWFTCV